MGTASYATPLLTYPSGYVHIVTTFSSTTNTSAIYVNGVFADVRSRTVPTVDGLSYITFGGVVNSNNVGPSSVTLAYFRVWNRTLTLEDAAALSLGTATGSAGDVPTTACTLLFSYQMR